MQVAVLRTVLGSDRDLIKTIAGRGYLLATETGRVVAKSAPHLVPPSGVGESAPQPHPDIEAMPVDPGEARSRRAADGTDSLHSLDTWEGLCALLHMTADELQATTSQSGTPRVPASLLEERACPQAIIARRCDGPRDAISHSPSHEYRG